MNQVFFPCLPLNGPPPFQTFSVGSLPDGHVQETFHLTSQVSKFKVQVVNKVLTQA